MAYKMNETTLLRAASPIKFTRKLKTSILKHQGCVARIAQDLNVGKTSIKRWLEEDPELEELRQRLRAIA